MTKPDKYDVLAMVGFILTACGLWQVYPPLVFIVGGVVLCGAAVAMARKHRAEGSKN